MAAGTASRDHVRRERLVARLLRGFSAQCALEKKTAGEEAFRVIEAAYKAEVGKIKPAAAQAGAKMDNAFAFVDACFGTREMLVFIAELATRKDTTQYLAHYGNETYYRHNADLQADSARMGLAERASMLEELAGNIDQERAAVPGDRAAAGLSLAGAETSAAAQRQEGAGGADALAAYYSGKQFEYGFTSVCKMLLPVSELKGKKVLDICCRRGRGVYKLSAMVGNGGSAMGVDWSPSYIAEAQDGMDRAWHDSGLARNNMEFRVAYPENLIAAGVGSGVFDMVYCNNVATLFFDQAQALKEFARVLKPGGLLVLETVFADGPRTPEVVEAARAAGNSVQAARTQEENFAWLEAAGFAAPSIEESYEVEAARGYKAGSAYQAVEGDADVRYRAVSLYVRKR